MEDCGTLNKGHSVDFKEGFKIFRNNHKTLKNAINSIVATLLNDVEIKALFGNIVVDATFSVENEFKNWLSSPSLNFMLKYVFMVMQNKRLMKSKEKRQQSYKPEKELEKLSRIKMNKIKSRQNYFNFFFILVCVSYRSHFHSFLFLKKLKLGN